jgi:hypothetical protein
MRRLLVPATAAWLMTLAAPACGATAELPRHEFWVALGVAASSEKSLFNLPNDIPSRPDSFLSLGYVRNLDARRALCFHLYGAVESRLAPLAGQSVAFELTSINLGIRYRYTFMRGAFTPFVFAGASWANGLLERKGMPDLDYNGVSACLGAGDALRMGRRVMLSAEGMISPGIAAWESAPFPGSTSKQFDPSLASATIHLSYLWGSPAAAPPPPGSPQASSSGKAAGYVGKFVLAEGMIALNAALASGSPGGYGVLFIVLSPLAAGEIHAASRAEKIVTLASFESIGIYNLIMAAGTHGEETVFTGNMIAWNTAIGITWAARKTIFKDRTPRSGGSGTKGWSLEPGVVGAGPGLRLAHRF